METRTVKTSLDSLSSVMLLLLEENIDIVLGVTGSSMNPLLVNNRDSVILKSCNKFELKKGDITLYKRQNGQYVLHRIIKVTDKGYNLCGDNQYVIEKDLPKENIIAVVNAFERKGKIYNCNNHIYIAYWRLRVASIPLRHALNRLRRIRGWIVI